MLTLSLFAQDQRSYDPIPKAIIGEWKASNPKEDCKFESVTFYPGGLLNIDTKGSKLVVNYKVAERPEGYEIFISGMNYTSPFSSFFIKFIEGDNMQITAKKDKSSKSVTLIKAKDIPYGILPLQAKNSISL